MVNLGGSRFCDYVRTRLVPRVCSEHTYLVQIVGNMLAEFVCVCDLLGRWLVTMKNDAEK